MAGGLETTSTLDFKVDEGLTSEVNNGLGGVSPEMDQQLHGEWRNLENTEYLKENSSQNTSVTLVYFQSLRIPINLVKKISPVEVGKFAVEF